MTRPIESDARYGLPNEALSRIRAVFAEHPMVEAVTLYGSRATGAYRPASDIDLSIQGRGVSWDDFNRIAAQLDDLLLPWKIDLALQHHIDNPVLLTHIHNDGIPIYP